MKSFSLAVSACYRYLFTSVVRAVERQSPHESAFPILFKHLWLLRRGWKAEGREGRRTFRTNVGLLSWIVNPTFFVGTFMRSLESSPSSFTVSLFRAGSNTEVERESPLSAVTVVCRSPWRLLWLRFGAHRLCRWGVLTGKCSSANYQGSDHREWVRRYKCCVDCGWSLGSGHSYLGMLSLPDVVKRHQRERVLAAGHISVC